MSQQMNPTSNVDFSHDAYMNEYKDQRFYGYQGHLQYLDYFVKTDVLRREGHHTAQQEQKEKPDPSKNNASKVGGEEEGKGTAAQQPDYSQIQVQNKPLIIAGDEGCGKTALVSYWLNHSPLFQQKHSKHQILLVHVAGASSCERKYQSFIHRALVKLRRTFPDVQTRLVHIIDDKLRINFSRCLDLVSNAIGTTNGSSGAGGMNQTQMDGGDTDRDNSGGSRDGRIIMILDGLENFRDSENDQGIDSEQSADWVPWSFPDRFRVIILTRKRSKAMNHFKLRKCPLLYMGDQSFFNAKEINNIIDEHIKSWRQGLNNGQKDSFEGRLSLIKNELVVKREQIFKEQQKSQRQQRDMLSEEQLLVFKSLEDELSEGNYHLLARPADELEAKFAKPTERQLNPLVIKCILYFYLFCGSSPYSGPHGLRPLDMKIILACKTLTQLFTTAIKHFRDCMFTGKQLSHQTPNSTQTKLGATNTSGTNIIQHQATSSTGLGVHSAEQGKEKFDQIMSYLIVSRKGVTWNEMKELIPNLTDEDIKLFTDIFGFLLVSYVPPTDTSASQASLPHTFIFFKHASFKKAVKDSIEALKNDQSRAMLHKNMATIIEKQEPTNQFMWQRRVDELCFHYQMSGMWIKLKDLISSVEVFSTMFVVPELRYELAQQWLWLLGQQSPGSASGASGTGGAKSSKQQCDPVVEYNKALESFIIKYRPTSKELFVIMIQLCRFFKEDLAELVSGAEAAEPQFAHPPLLGTREIEAIRLLKEVEKLESLYIPDREQEQQEKEITTSSQLIASLKGFNLDNAIVREQIIDMIRREVRAETQAKEHQMISMIDDEMTTHYHYKRWLWVQFPWCTIDVHSDISNIMELFSGGSSQGADSSLYISATKENELSKATLAILHAAKQRSKKSYSNGTNKSLNQSHASSALNQSLKKKGNKKNSMNISKPKIGMLPPVVPQSAKHGNESMLDKSKTMIIGGAGNRSISAGRGRDIGNTSSSRLPLLRLDSEDRKSPEKTLAKISITMNNIEQGKMKEIEHENVQLGAQLNNLNFMIYRKEKELKQLEEHYTAVMIEHSINSEGQHKLEVMEAKLLRAYQDLNRVEVERKRIEQIVKACEKNPPNNEEQIRNLEQQIDVFVKLITHHQTLMSNAHKEQELYKKQLSELVNEMQKQENERSLQINKITDVVERKRRLQILMIEGDEERKNFAMFPIESQDVDIGKLKHRQQNYKKWKAKLNVTKAFVSEKRLLFESSFRKMIEIAGLRKVDTQSLLHKENPLQNLEGLIAFIERANDLDKSKRQKETKIEKLKREKEELLAELRKWENGGSNMDGNHMQMMDAHAAMNEASLLERAQKKLYLEDKQLRTVKEVQQRQLSLIADLKSGFVNVAKILGIEEGLETESDQTQLIEKICERFQKLENYRHGSKIDLALGGSDTMSGAPGDSHRSSKPEDNNLLSPQGTRTRKKQPKQKQANGGETGPSGKHSPAMVGASTMASTLPAGSSVGGQTLPMKLQDMRDSRDVDSDTEERQQLAQDRMRLKKNISSNGNYALQKVLQPPQGGTGSLPQSAPGTAGGDKVEDGNLTTKAGARKSSVGMTGVSTFSRNITVDKFKKSNLTASNPIIGAPLGDKSIQARQAARLNANQSQIQIKSRDLSASAQKQPGLSSQISSKPMLGNSKIPKYTTKKIKFAKGIDGGESLE